MVMLVISGDVFCSSTTASAANVGNSRFMLFWFWRFEACLICRSIECLRCKATRCVLTLWDLLLVDLLETDESALNQETCHSDHRSVHICRHVKARVNLPVKGYADSSSVLPKIDGLMFRTQLNIIFLAIDLSCCTLSGKFPFSSRNFCHWLRDSLGSCSMKYIDTACQRTSLWWSVSCQRNHRCRPAVFRGKITSEKCEVQEVSTDGVVPLNHQFCSI